MIQISEKDLAKELMAREKDFPGLALRAMAGAARRGKALLVRRTPKDRGQAKAGWRVRKDSQGVDIVNDVPYIGIIERGARPHAVSKEGFLAIFRWVNRVIKPSADRRSYQRGGRSKIQGPQRVTVIYGWPFTDRDVPAAQIALAIVRKIGREGQKPTYFVRNTMGDLENMFKVEYERRLKKAAARRASRRSGGK